MKKTTAFLLLLFLLLQGKAQYSSIFWKISGNGLEHPSYLFGTMHTGDARVFDNVKRAMPYLTDAKAFVMELDPDKLFDVGLLGKIMMGKDYSLRKMITAGDYSFLDSVVTQQIGMPLTMMDNVQPVFVMTILESMEMGLNSDTTNGTREIMDLYFYNEAKDEKKKIIGIETVEEQLGALNTLSYEEQATMLSDDIKSLKTKGNDGRDVLKFYMEQNLDSLAGSDDDMPPKLYKALVTDRNERMADRIAKFVKQQATFIAIGALHLPFKGGVIELLRQRGFTVEPVRN